MSTSKNRKFPDETSDIMRLHHYSIHTERAYSDWIKRYIRYHGMTCRDDLKNGEAKIEAFLTHLAIDAKDVTTTIIYTHALQQGGQGVLSPLDDLDI